jgi:hypothetical protein
MERLMTRLENREMEMSHSIQQQGTHYQMMMKELMLMKMMMKLEMMGLTEARARQPPGAWRLLSVHRTNP